MNLQRKVIITGIERNDKPIAWLTAPMEENYPQKRNQKGNILTKCLCPKCEKHHFVQMRWIGRGEPRKYCRRCKSVLFSEDIVKYQYPIETQN